jgi:hypothetical protein
MTWYEEPKQGAKPDRGDFTGSGSWQKPEPRWGADPEGRRIRTYECLFCRDTGVVVLPAHQAGETTEDLLDLRRIVTGRSHAHCCPNCRSGETLWEKRPVLPGVGERLLRWYWAMKDRLREQAAQEVVESRQVVAAGIAAVAKPIPLSVMLPASAEETFARRFIQDFARRYPLLPPPTPQQIADAEAIAKARAVAAGMGPAAEGTSDVRP